MENETLTIHTFDNYVTHNYVTEGPLSGATRPRFFMQKYAIYWPEGGAASQYIVCLLARKCH
jgi:hypothetical protein